MDVCHGKTMTKERQIVLYLVFEHCDQDLATYMAKCPLPGLHEQTIKVCSIAILRYVLIKFCIFVHYLFFFFSPVLFRI